MKTRSLFVEDNMGKKSRKKKTTSGNPRPGTSGPTAKEQKERHAASVSHTDYREFKLGDRVSLKDLATTKYNGRHGTITSFQH